MEKEKLKARMQTVTKEAMKVNTNMRYLIGDSERLKADNMTLNAKLVAYARTCDQLRVNIQRLHGQKADSDRRIQESRFTIQQIQSENNRLQFFVHVIHYIYRISVNVWMTYSLRFLKKSRLGKSLFLARPENFNDQ